MTTLTHHEKLACTALARLFLDTEKAPLELDSIAASLRPLDMSTDTLSQLLRYDVFPILYPNMLSVAGEWDGFDENWLLGRIEAHRRTGHGWARGLADRARGGRLGGRWRRRGMPCRRGSKP